MNLLIHKFYHINEDFSTFTYYLKTLIINRKGCTFKRHENLYIHLHKNTHRTGIFTYTDSRKENIMRELHHFDIFTLPNSKSEENIVCVTTNGIIKRDGTAVMGAGIAKTANLRFKVAEKLADSLRANGNVVNDLGTYYWKTSRFHLVAFPTKHDWRNPSDLQLIEQSAKQLVTLVNTNGFQHIFLTRPGCGLGQLDWESQVKPILEPILDDRFTIVYR